MNRLLLPLFVVTLGCAAILAVPHEADAPLVRATADQVDMAIHGQESGGAANAKRSVRGAVGGHQIMPATFMSYRRGHESINSPTDNATVGLRIVTALMEQYDDDAARVAVAYFSGPGNVSPVGSRRPYISNFSDGHVSVAQYVAQVLARLPSPVIIPAPAVMPR